jgi:hypothetical protein
MACSNSEALFSVRCVFASFNICTPLFICLIRSVCEINLSVCFNGDVFFRFFELAAFLMFILSVNYLRITLFILVREAAAISSSD